MFIDFFHHGAPPPPPFLSHLASAYCMYYALGVFAAVYEYTCPFTPLSRSFISPLPPSLPPLSFLPASLQLPSWQISKQTASFGPVLFLSVASSHSSQHGYAHTHEHRDAKHKHAHTGLTPYTPRGVLLTQIQTHQSHPLWNDSGKSQVNITACKDQTHTKAKTDGVPVYVHVCPNSAA